jgi:hypothetical protein
VAITNHTTNAMTFPTDGSTVTWAAVPNGNQGDSIAEDWASAFFQVTGTFGAGGSVQIEGSNDGSTWVKLSPAALTAAGLFAALGATERPKFVRPNVTAGDGTTALTVTGFLRKSRLGVT